MSAEWNLRRRIDKQHAVKEIVPVPHNAEQSNRRDSGCSQRDAD